MKAKVIEISHIPKVPFDSKNFQLFMSIEFGIFQTLVKKKKTSETWEVLGIPNTGVVPPLKAPF